MQIRAIELSVSNSQNIHVREGAMFLSIHTDKSKPVSGAYGIRPAVNLYVAENINNPYIPKEIITVGVDTPCSDTGVLFIGSYTLKEGAFVAHVFEKVK